MKIGAQLFTVKDTTQTLDGLAEALKKVADMGYTAVQVSGTCEYEPLWLKEQLDKNGLKCVITHAPRERVINEPAAVAKEHDVFGCKYVGLGWFGFDVADGAHEIEDFAKVFVPVTNILSEHGKYFMYHNHGHEFRKVNNKPIMQLLAELMPADKMGFTLDTYWVQCAGGDPAQWLERLSGRVPCIHLKDCTYDRKMAVIGEGNINFDRVFQNAEKAGTEYMLVEQDDCYGEDPFDCLKRSYDYLKSCGLN